jgi:hypothetical protein
LGLAKTCMKLKLSFYEFLGSRLGLPGSQIPHLAELIRLIAAYSGARKFAPVTDLLT